MHYHADDAVQSNVREDYIRATHKTKQKKKAKQAPKKRQAKAETTEATPKAQKRKSGRPKGSKNKSPNVKVAEEYTLEELSLATEIGLPDGWGARKTEKKRGDFKWSIKSPDGKTFDSKKKAFAAAGLEYTEQSANGKGKGGGRGRKRKPAEVVEEEVEELEDAASDPPVEESVDEGDPPWRTTDHPFLSRRIRWTPPAENSDLPNEPSVGTVVGWISETDVDSEGNPGFVSSKTGQPACLFHALFDDFEQDFEEWELEEIFLKEDDE